MWIYNNFKAWRIWWKAILKIKWKWKWKMKWIKWKNLFWNAKVTWRFISSRQTSLVTSNQVSLQCLLLPVDVSVRGELDNQCQSFVVTHLLPVYFLDLAAWVCPNFYKEKSVHMPIMQSTGAEYWSTDPEVRLACFYFGVLLLECLLG